MGGGGTEEGGSVGGGVSRSSSRDADDDDGGGNEVSDSAVKVAGAAGLYPEAPPVEGSLVSHVTLLMIADIGSLRQLQVTRKSRSHP